ncbi:hypothetical protein ANO11243_006890 [Dothideomycetidae sp. 11243]|nr:hypothetical protein ANO11243_006890 [fungal sp. No.11243]
MGSEHGVKRQADDALDDEQRFTKRFNLLNIVDNPSKLYIPLDTRHHVDSDTDTMAVDDTPHRVYIHDLDAEVAAIDAADAAERANTMIFLPDIERALVAPVPKRVLLHPVDVRGKELVLYGAGASADGDAERERDAVRRAIADTQRRARERWKCEHAGAASAAAVDAEVVETAHGFDADEYEPREARPHTNGKTEQHQDEDEDAMDIG